MYKIKDKIKKIKEKNENNQHKKEKLITEMTIHEEDLNQIFLEDSDRLDIRNFTKLNGMTINIYESEGTIPHFHLEKPSSNFYSAIRLDDAKYFRHNKYQDTQNSNQRKALYKFLKQPMDEKRNKDFTRWDHLVFMWNSTIRHGHNKNYCDTIVMPNYRELE